MLETDVPASALASPLLSGTVFARWQQSVPFARPKIEDLLPGLARVIENDYPARGTAT
ncbi:hypothetical protein [Jannaschia marina]|uniref:hypothetical protein n=1 Tax=Jannaschia marina TaxID=2741674 RepID=UPI0015C97614|nr:hypothetical protein [Jannaschia marina]